MGSLTYFPNGILTPNIVGGGIEKPVVGNVYFVGATAGLNWVAGVDDPSCGSITNPFATIDYAIGKCTAANYDTIYVMPGHTETISAATSLVCDVAGVTIIGLGYGNARPTLTFSAVGAYIPISAANVTIKNIILKPGIDEVVKLFYITAAGVTLDTVDYQSVSTHSTLQFVLTTNAADQLTIQNCYHYQLTAGGSAQKWIQLVGTDSTRIWNNRFNIVAANASTSSICISGSTAVIDVDVRGNDIVWGGATITKIIEMVTTSTGIIAHNHCLGGAAVLLTAAITGDACLITDNYVTNTVGTASGALAPAADTVT
jgi:hypothetical protein